VRTPHAQAPETALVSVHHPLTRLWLVLVLTTVLSWWLGVDTPARTEHSFAWSTVAILAVAIIKCRLVMRSYMEVKSAPRWLQLSCDAWLLLNIGMMSWFYWLSR
jgi:heme/copper-type cytochrome/quinol oxidase subunit 4